MVTELISLDGVVEAPGGEDFTSPGWSFEFDRGDDGNQIKLARSSPFRRRGSPPVEDCPGGSSP